MRKDLPEPERLRLADELRRAAILLDRGYPHAALAHAREMVEELERRLTALEPRP